MAGPAPDYLSLPNLLTPSAKRQIFRATFVVRRIATRMDHEPEKALVTQWS